MHRSAFFIPVLIVASVVFIGLVYLTGYKHQEKTQLVTSVRTNIDIPSVELVKKVKKKLQGTNLLVPEDMTHFMKVRIADYTPVCYIGTK